MDVALLVIDLLMIHSVLNECVCLLSAKNSFIVSFNVSLGLIESCLTLSCCVHPVSGWQVAAVVFVVRLF